MATGTRREILRLAVPAFLALVAEPLFLLADSAVVGHLGVAQLAGLGVASSVMQAAIAVIGLASQFYLTPISLVPLLACAAWAVASGLLAFELVRFRHAMRSDIGATRGFEVATR